MNKEIRIKRKVILKLFLFLLIAVFSAVYIRYTWIKTDHEQSDNILQLGKSIEASLPKENLKMLQARPGDIDKPEYQIIKKILKEVIHANPKAKFAYIYTEKGGKIYFIADSEPVYSKDYSPPGQEYTEAKTEDKQPFRDGKALITSHVTDRWGTWVSALIPIKDEATGKTIAVFGLDFNAKTWDNFILFEVIESSVLIVLLLLTFFFLLQIREKNRSLKNEITERTHAKEDLEESREKYRGLSEAAFESIFMSEKGLCIEQNPAAEKMFGYTTEEALVRYGTDWIVPEDRDMVMKNMLAGHEDAYEAIALRKDGTTFPCVLRGKMMYYKGKNVRVTSLTDISSLKQAEEELKQLSTRLILATRAGGVGVWDYDIVNNTLLWDDHMFELYGIAREDFSGVYEAWRSGIHAEDMERGDAEIQMAIQGEKEFDTEFRVIWPNGSIHYIRAIAVVQRDATGQPLRMIGTNWDITALRNAERQRLDDSENRYRCIFQGSPDGILIIEAESKMIMFANSAQCEMLGYSEEQLKAMNITGIHPEDTVQHTMATLEKQARGEKFLAENIQCRKSNGEILYADINSSQIVINGRKHLVGFFRDTTKRKLAEELIMLKNEEIAKLNAANHLSEIKSGFIITASHEFRTPLATILASAETLMAYRERMPIEQIDQRLNTIIGQVSHMTLLMEKMVEMMKRQ